MITRFKVLTSVAVSSGFVVGATVVLSGATRAVFDINDSTAWVENDGAASVTQLDPGGAAGTVRLGETNGDISTIMIDGVPYAFDDDGIRRIDPKTLSVTDEVEFAGLGAQAVGGGGRLYAVDSRAGTVTEYDPADLAMIGRPVEVGGVLGSAVVDADGVLWVPQTDTGHVVGVLAGEQVAEHAVAQPNAQLQLTVVSDEVVVINRTDNSMLTVTVDEVGEPHPIDASVAPVEDLPTVVASGSTLPMLDTDGNLLIYDVSSGELLLLHNNYE